MHSELPINFASLKRTKPSLKEGLLKLLWECSPHGAALDALLTRRLPELRHLTELDAVDCIPDFDTSPVTIRQCPAGAWSTPLIDTVVLAKCALGFHSRKILEIGSYLGHTAKLLAENTSTEARITTLDEYPEHGTAYRGSSLDQKIERRVGKVSLDCFNAGDEYDLIFVDADHRFDSVINDTRVALSLLSAEGVLIWHDYQHLHHFQGFNDVPEALKLFTPHLPIIAVKGTWLALYSRHPGWTTASLLQSASREASTDAWHDRSLRG